MDNGYWQFESYGDPAQVLGWREGPQAAPGPGEVLLQLSAIGMNRSEANYVRGNYAPAPYFPSCLGQEACGVIVDVGPPDPDRPALFPLASGERACLLPGRVDMCGMGAYRNLGIYRQDALAPAPDDYSDAEAAALWMGVLTMAGALDLAGLNPENSSGRKVLVTAASSSMGVIALKLLRAWGAETIATTRSEEKRGALDSLSDHVVVCDNPDALASGVRAVTGDAGFDIALDPVGELYYPGLIEAAAIGGCIVSYEMITGREPALPIAQLMIKDLSLRGYTIFRPYRVPGLLDNLLRLGIDYAADIRPIVAAQYPLVDAVPALEDLLRNEHLGKLVLLNQG